MLDLDAMLADLWSADAGPRQAPVETAPGGATATARTQQMTPGMPGAAVPRGSVVLGHDDTET